MAQFDINLTESDVFWSNFLMGLGQSVAFTPMTMMAFATLPRHQITEGAAVFTLMRNFGSSLFISLAVLVLVRSTSVQLRADDGVHHALPQGADAAGPAGALEPGDDERAAARCRTRSSARRR